MSIEAIRSEVQSYLIEQGYTPEIACKISSQIARVKSYFKGKPSVVVTYDGTEMYL